MLTRIISAVLALGIGAFSVFVGWHKAFSPLDALAQHHAWTTWIPEWQGGIVGWAEMAAALALVLPIFVSSLRQVQFWSAILLILLQVAAAWAHAANGEADALWQNGAFVLILAIIAFDARTRSEPAAGSK
jgi:DoxX-like family